MKFAIRKKVITPDIPVLQGGFAARTHKSEGVHDDAYATVCVLQENRTAVIIALDLLFGDRSFAQGIRSAIESEFSIKDADVLINFSHTHSVVGVTGDIEDLRSPRTYSISSDKFSWDANPSDIDFTEDMNFYNKVKNAIMSSIRECMADLTQGSAYIAKGSSLFGVSRRYPHNGTVLWKPYFNEDAIDKDLFVICLTDKNEDLKGIIYSYACHPTSLGSDNYYISADYPGVVRKYLESSNPGACALFLQGCGADIKPKATARDGSFISCNFDELEVEGKSLADTIQNIIDNKSMFRKIDFNLFSAQNEVKLFTKVWSRDKWESIVNDPSEASYRVQSAKMVLKDFDKISSMNYMPYIISLLRLDDKTAIISLECEVVSYIGKCIKEILKGSDIISLGYSNSSRCYIPTRKILKEGGYESASFVPARLSGPFEDEIEDIIIGRSCMLASCKQSL